MKSELFPFQEHLVQSHEEERNRGVSTGFLSRALLTVRACVTTPGLPGGGDVPLVLSVGPAFWSIPRVGEATLIYGCLSTPFFPTLPVCGLFKAHSRERDTKESAYLGSGFEQALTFWHTLCLKMGLLCFSGAGLGCGLCRCLLWLPEHGALSFSIGDPV